MPVLASNLETSFCFFLPYPVAYLLKLQTGSSIYIGHYKPNETELGVGIYSGIALTPLPSSIGQGLNLRPSDREPSAVPLDHSFRFYVPMLAERKGDIYLGLLL